MTEVKKTSSPFDLAKTVSGEHDMKGAAWQHCLVATTSMQANQTRLYSSSSDREAGLG